MKMPKSCKIGPMRTWGLILFFTLSISFSSASSFPSSYYISQGMKYFDTLDTYASRSSKPNYAEDVIRWEWYPWLKLTGYKRWMMKLDLLLILYPTEVIDRDCRFFKVQPFCRCRVSFKYAGVQKLVKIYEEFTFNQRGEMIFIEAWSDEAKLLPWDFVKDPWGEGEKVRRLSTKVPFLEDGVNTEELKLRAAEDPELQDLVKRMEDPVQYWFMELFRALKEASVGK